MRKSTVGRELREARRTLKLTQREVASRVGVDPGHIAFLELDRRKPSLQVLLRLAEVLGLNRRKLFLLVHPDGKEFIGAAQASAAKSAVDARREFASNRRLLSRHRVTAAELRVLRKMSLQVPLRRSGDFLFVLNTIRQAMDPAE